MVRGMMGDNLVPTTDEELRQFRLNLRLEATVDGGGGAADSPTPFEELGDME